ncbi:hypothetical protein [Nostoc sp. C117]
MNSISERVFELHCNFLAQLMNSLGGDRTIITQACHLQKSG